MPILQTLHDKGHHIQHTTHNTLFLCRDPKPLRKGPRELRCQPHREKTLDLLVQSQTCDVKHKQKPLSD